MIPTPHGRCKMEQTSDAVQKLLDLVAQWREAVAADPLSLPSWLELAQELLRFCDGNRPAASSWALPAGSQTQWLDDVESRVVEALDAANGDEALDMLLLSSPSVADLEALEDTLSKATADLLGTPEARRDLVASIVANGAARGIEDLYQDSFLEWDRGHGHTELESGRAFVTTRHNPLRLLGRNGANTNPAHMPGRSLIRTGRLVLADHRVSAYTFTQDYDMWNRMGPLGEGPALRIAALGPLLSVADFDIVADSTTGTFVNRGPRDRARTMQVVRAQVRAAADAEADVIVLPEYTLDERGWDELQGEVTALTHRPTLVVAGVAGEGATEGTVSNEARVMLTTPGHPAFVGRPHQKLHGATIGGVTEQIVEGTEVRVFVGQRWTVAVLECFDAMSPDIFDVLAQLGVNLLIVPAMTPKTATMVSLAQRLTSESQAFVALVAGPPLGWAGTGDARYSPNRCEAMFAGPYASHGTLTYPTADDCPPPDVPGLWLFDSVAAHAKFIPTPVA
jgi:hypothetical protein